MNFSRNILSYTLIPLFILLVGSSYLRFVVYTDYVVGYESECDPETNVCFVGCENDECTDKYYYKKMQKYAPNLHNQCGEDITGCEKANVCLQQNDEKCSIVYCNPKIDIDECEDLSNEAPASDFIQTEQVDDDLYENINTTGL